MNYGNSEKNNLIWKEFENKYFDASYKIDPDNKNASFSLLSQSIEDGCTVLDVGCNDGKWGRLLKKKHCICYGIDISEAAIQFLKDEKNYEKVAVCNIEDTDAVRQIQTLRKEFDYIGCFDVLEHMVNPSDVLLKLCLLLKWEGKILVSIPNIGNADIFLNLIRGCFNYSDTGILDNTHNKFFTKNSFVEWIDSINSIQKNFQLECEYIGGTFGYTKYLETVKRKYPNLFSAIQLNPQFNVVQLLFVLTKRKRNCKLKYLPTLLDTSLSDDLLVVLESAFLNDDKMSGFFLKNNVSANEREDYINRIDTLTKQLENYKTREGVYQEAINERDVYAHELECANEKWGEYEQKLDEANKGWNECAQRLDEANKGWSECAQKLNEANKGWSECAQKLDEANKGWGECAQKLDEANRGWSECAQRLDEANKGWSECAQKLETIIRDREYLIQLLNEKEEYLRKRGVQISQLETDIMDGNKRFSEIMEKNKILKELLEEEKILYRDVYSKCRKIEEEYRMLRGRRIKK